MVQFHFICKHSRSDATIEILLQKKMHLTCLFLMQEANHDIRNKFTAQFYINDITN